MAVTDGKQIMDKIASIKSDTSPTADKLRATIAGGTVGMIGGIYYGYSRRKNVLVSALLGGALGAIVTRLLMPK
jgi:gas vesicle protein